MIRKIPGYTRRDYVNQHHHVVVIESDDSNRDDPTLVLVHGIGVSHRYFEPFMRAMRGRRVNVVALDLPGYGLARDPDDTLTIDQLADLVNQFVRDQGYPDCTIVGHSMGSQIAVEAVCRDEELYHGAILLAPTINRSERKLHLQAWRLLQDTLREPIGVNWIVLTDYLRMGIGRYLRTSRSMLNDKLEEDITRPRLPVVVVNGTRDPICPDEWAEHLVECAHDAELAEIDGGAHVFQYSHPEELREICETFLAR